MYMQMVMLYILQVKTHVPYMQKLNCDMIIILTDERLNFELWTLILLCAAQEHQAALAQSMVTGRTSNSVISHITAGVLA